MTHPVKIAGRETSLAWDNESAKRYFFRMGEIGGEPTHKQLSNPKTVTTALFKVLWGLLPGVEFQKYPDPESLFVAVDHETEAAAIFAAITQVFQDRFPDDEKKSTSTTSPLPESNSD